MSIVFSNITPIFSFQNSYEIDDILSKRLFRERILDANRSDGLYLRRKRYKFLFTHSITDRNLKNLKHSYAFSYCILLEKKYAYE